MLCGSVACPLLARTLGRIAGGCGAAGTVVGIGCPWYTCKRLAISSQKSIFIPSLETIEKEISRGKKELLIGSNRQEETRTENYSTKLTTLHTNIQ